MIKRWHRILILMDLLIIEISLYMVFILSSFDYKNVSKIITFLDSAIILVSSKSSLSTSYSFGNDVTFFILASSANLVAKILLFSPNCSYLLGCIF